ncbi:LLM class flavin-dependent oxidoreductase [Nocardioides hwasunensis]|uniref:LLM class flavin-dependent oxidoreductase n=1 Tax=Nocardioides hwasunensis TaxID=397258 RepID=A0ABR8MLE4_9ACTN|nr:LLM class flavin-dependent oxidoreductase [Nocardioides hwasunensis]MBD3915615.1 LLM class flavin-dependent oxidoreductase [Nocardioides hwasunensis]
MTNGDGVEIGLVDLFDGGVRRDPAFMATFARTAEQLGFSGIWVPEHLMFFDHYESAYPYPNHPSADDPDKLESHNKTVGDKAQVEAAEDQGLLDVQQTAAELCAATTRLRVGASVMILPVRNMRTLHRELQSLAELTGGRFDLGVGVGWSSEEVTACESDFRTRGRRCTDYLADLAGGWGSAVSGVDRPAPRTLIAGHSPAALKRAASVGTGWYPYNLTISEFTEHHATYTRLLEDNGRDRADQHAVAGVRYTGDLAGLRQFVDRYAEAGADGVNISLRLGDDDYAETMAEVSDILGLAR